MSACARDEVCSRSFSSGGSGSVSAAGAAVRAFLLNSKRLEIGLPSASSSQAQPSHVSTVVEH